MPHGSERGAELVRDRRNEIALKASDGELPLDDAPEKIAAPDEQQHDRHEPQGQQAPAIGKLL